MKMTPLLKGIGKTRGSVASPPFTYTFISPLFNISRSTLGAEMSAKITNGVSNSPSVCVMGIKV